MPELYGKEALNKRMCLPHISSLPSHVNWFLRWSIHPLCFRIWSGRSINLHLPKYFRVSHILSILLKCKTSHRTFIKRLSKVIESHSVVSPSYLTLRHPWRVEVVGKVVRVVWEILFPGRNIHYLTYKMRRKMFYNQVEEVKIEKINQSIFKNQRQYL